MPEVDIITGGSRVRHWTDEEKVSILQAAFAPGAITVHVAKRMNVSTGQLYTWRKQLINPPSPRSSAMKKEAAHENGFAQVVVASDHTSFASSPTACPVTISPSASPVQAITAPEPGSAPPSLSPAMLGLPAIEIEMKGNRVRIPATMPPALASAVVRALVRR